MRSLFTLLLKFILYSLFCEHFFSFHPHLLE
jgi:hypothetical protein